MIALSNNRPSVNATVASDFSVNEPSAKEALRTHIDQLSIEQQMDFVAAALQLIANRPMRSAPFVKAQRKAAQC